MDRVSGQVSTDTHQRLYYVMDQITAMVPDNMKDHPMAKMLAVFTREGKKDLRRIPAPFIEGLARQVGEAFTWVADGSMGDVKVEVPESSEG